MSLYHELKRRNVFRVAITLAVMALPLTVTAMQGDPPVRGTNTLKDLQSVPVMTLPWVDAAQRLNEDALQTKSAPLRYAMTTDMSVTPDNAGQWEQFSDGARIWRYRVYSPGATDLNFGFTHFRLPRGATLHVYSEVRDFYQGPYTSADNKDHGQHWTPMVPGDRAVIELYLPAKFRESEKSHPAQDADQRLRGSVLSDPLDLELGRVGSGYRDLFGLQGKPNLTQKGACVIDTICPQGDNWRDEIRSVAMYSLGGGSICSGTLINDVPQSFTPYFITAHHCGVTAGNAASVVVFWNYESPQCGDLSGGVLTDTQSGSILRSTKTDVDFTLLELSSAPDDSYNAFWSGWDRRDYIPQSAVGIHHPNGGEKRISFDYDPLTTVGNCIGVGDTDTHLFVGWDLGVTEPGASGSGLWEPTGRLVGQLSGSTSACAGDVPNDGCDWYGRFSEAWDSGSSSSERLRDWLDPEATGILIVDGAEPTGGVCGDSVLDVGETCDDGNTTDDDGCSLSCQVEAGYSCTAPIPSTMINGVPDGGFEGGTPNPAWTESSTNFNTPLCDIATCGIGVGTGPSSGDWWVWFGGVAAVENGSVEQTLIIEDTDTELTFEVEQPVCDSQDDFARVLIDNTEVFITNGADPACGNVGYKTITIDMATAPGGPYNIGLPRNVRAESQIYALNLGSSSFYFDNFTLNRGSSPSQPSVCSITEPTFLLAGDNLAQQVCKPQSDPAINLAGINLNMPGMLDLTDPVTLSTSDLPTGFNGSFTVNPVTPTGTSIAQFSVGPTATIGHHVFEIVASGGIEPDIRSLTVDVDVFDATPEVPVLSTPANGATTDSIITTLEWNTVSQTISYTVEVDDDPAFGSIDYTGETSETTAVTGPLAGTTTYYWRVRANNTCGTSAESDVFAFITPLQICSTPGVVIPDGVGSVSDDMVVAATGEILDLKVQIGISHTWIGDIGVTLTHVESAANVTLLDRPGIPATQFGCSGNNISVTLNDVALSAAEDQCKTDPALTGTHSPNSPLSAFNGENRSGTWRLTVTDAEADDNGTLDIWCLYIGSVAREGLIFEDGFEGRLVPDLSTSTKAEDDVDNIVAPGQTVTYTITLINSGSGEATGVNINDVIDAGTENLTNFTFTNCGSSFTNSSAGSTVDIYNLDVAVGTDCVVTYDVDVKSSLPGGTIIDNQVTIGVATEGGAGATPSSTTLLVDASPDQ